MFYFQQLFNTAMTGIDSGGATAGVVQIAQYILLASLLFGIYEAWARGGDTHFLGATAVRFFAVGLVMVTYGSAFRDVNGMFNNVASFINTSTAGGGDVFGQWMSDLSNYWNNNNGIQALWGMITGAFSGLLESLLLLVGYILFPVTYALFSLFYALYGSILYVVGPFVLALYPAFGFGVMARKYLVNLMIFNAWGVLYSIFGALMAAINMNSVNAVLNSGNFVGAFNGVTGSLLLGLASILLSLCIALIPFLAKRIVEGDVGQTMISVISTSVIAARSVGSLFSAGGGTGGAGGAGSGGGAGGGFHSGAGDVAGLDILQQVTVVGCHLDYMTVSIQAEPRHHVGYIALAVRQPTTREAAEVGIIGVKQFLHLGKIFGLRQPATLTNQHAQGKPLFRHLKRLLGQICV